MRLSVHTHTPLFHLSVLFAITFVLAPLCFNNLLYSPLFFRRLHLKRLSHEFLSQNLQDGDDALQYIQRKLFSSAPFHEMSSLSSLNISLPCNHEATKAPHRSQTNVRVPLAVTIITTRRQREYHYPLQVARGLLDRISECGSACSDIRLFICNVDESPSLHTDACLLSNILPSVVRHTKEQIVGPPNIFEQEKQDYAFCLSQTLETFNPEYVLLLEDDAVPKTNLFHAFFHLVNVRFPQEPLGGGLYVKMYHPERLQGYLNPEPMRILEWFGLGSFVGLVLTLAYNKLFHQSTFNWRVFAAFAVYAMLLAEVMGRHYLLELRRASPALYNVVPATECCTPAMLFSEASARRTLGYLEEITCKHRYAKDTAIYKELKRRGEWAWALEPNMVSHVGMFSTLRVPSVEEPQLL
ncbi:post-GPI attachment to proteins factor 4 isoform 1-T7 [Discoglossus pictus]